MSDVLSTLFWAFLPLLVLWFVITGLVTAAALRIAGPSAADSAALPTEVWLAIVASGAAAGGFLGLGSVVPTSVSEVAALTAMNSLLSAVAGMVLGGAATAGLGLLVTWWWRN